MFHHCKTKEEVKSLYFKLANFLHPDKGGDCYLFSLLKETYEMALELKVSSKSKNSSGKKYETVYDDVLEDEEAIKIIDDIYEYAKAHPKYKTDFLDSVNEFLNDKGYITSSQYNSLVRAFYAFKMNEK